MTAERNGIGKRPVVGPNSIAARGKRYYRGLSASRADLKLPTGLYPAIPAARSTAI